VICGKKNCPQISPIVADASELFCENQRDLRETELPAEFADGCRRIGIILRNPRHLRETSKAIHFSKD